MIKVLHIFNEYLPKTEAWAYHLIAAAASFQHDILAKYYNQNGKEIGPELTKHYVKENTLRLSYDATSKKDVIKKIKLWNHSRILPSFQNQIREVVPLENYPIVHFHFGTTAADYIEVFESISSKKVVSFYGWDYTKAPQVTPKYVGLYERLFKAADLILVEGPAGKERLTKLGCHPNKIQFMPLGIHEIPRSNKSKPKDKLRLIQIASFSEKKGQLYAVEAFHLCIKMGLDVELTLVGDPREAKYKAMVIDRIEELNIRDKVKCISWINFEEISTFLQNYDAFIHPSCHAQDGDCEGGAPVIILQAQANGLPIIATNHCDIPNQIKNGVTGYLTPERSSEELAHSIKQIYEMTDEKYKKMSSDAYQWVHDNFEYKQLGHRLEKMYSQMIDNH